MSIQCGINISSSNLRNQIGSKLSSFVNLSGTLGTPAGLIAIKATLNDSLLSIKANFDLVIPEIPNVPEGLRDALTALAALPLAGVAAAAKIISIAEEYADMLGITGFANINLTDLAKSVYSLDFDVCGKLIPNIVKSADGSLVKLPSISPDLGSTTIADASTKIQEITNNFDTATVSNVALNSSDSIEKTLANIQTNIQPAISGLGDMIRKLPDGSQVLESQSDLINRLKERSSILV